MEFGLTLWCLNVASNTFPPPSPGILNIPSCDMLISSQRDVLSFGHIAQSKVG